MAEIKEFKFSTENQKIFFTSDMHFQHDNIIKFCDRPFASVEEMNETLIKNWNSVVGENDIVFNLGDFAWGGSKVWNDCIHALNGKHYLIIGNHDDKNLRQGYRDKFEFVGYQMSIIVNGQKIYLNHYPFLCFAGCHDKNNRVWQLHGHVHTSKYKNLGLDFEMVHNEFPTQYDVGVDLNDFTPISFEKLQERMHFQVENGVNCLYWIDHE